MSPVKKIKIGREEKMVKKWKIEAAKEIKEKRTARAPKPVDDGEDLFAEVKPEIKKGKKKAKVAETIFTDKEGIPMLRGERKLVKLTELRPNPFNYNSQSDFIYEKLKASIQEFGFVEPITVRSSNEEGPLGFYEIVGGEHRWKAATELKMTEVPVNDIGMMTDDSLKKFMVVLNETKGRPNNDQLAAVLNELSKDGVDMSVLPFDDAEIKSLVSMGNFDFDNTDVTTDLGSGADSGSSDDDEDEGNEWVGIEDALDLEGLKHDNWKKDEEYAKRLKNVMTKARIPVKSPWQVLDTLLSAYYKVNKTVEEMPVDEDLEGDITDEPEDADDKKIEDDDD